MSLGRVLNQTKPLNSTKTSTSSTPASTSTGSRSTARGPTHLKVMDHTSTAQEVAHKQAHKTAVGRQDTAETFARNSSQPADKTSAPAVKATQLTGPNAAPQALAVQRPAPAHNAQGKALVEDLKTQSPAIKAHLEKMEAQGTRVEVVKNDPSMQTDAYFDTKSNTIRVREDANPAVMKDNILFESCNAAHRGQFKTAQDQFNNGKSTPRAFGEATAKAEFSATAQYVDLINGSPDKSRLPARAQGALDWAEKTAPGYLKDPAGKRGALEQAFLTSPHDAKAKGGVASLSTPDMYTYEKIQGFQDKDMRRVLQHAVTQGGTLQKPNGFNNFLDNQVSGKFANLPADQKPARYEELLLEARNTFKLPETQLAPYQLTSQQRALAVNA